MSEYILDSSALLALMFLEPGKERVEEILDSSVIGRVNLTEVITKLLEKGSTLAEACKNIEELELTIVQFDKTQPEKTAELRHETKHLGLSLGDRACLALAIRKNATAITADRNWKEIDVCSIELIR